MSCPHRKMPERAAVWPARMTEAMPFSFEKVASLSPAHTNDLPPPVYELRDISTPSPPSAFSM